MKKLILLLVLTIVSLDSFSQDVTIPLQEFTLEVPKVNRLMIRPNGSPKRKQIDSVTTITVQPVYYKLVRVDGKAAEEGNEDLPIQMYNNVFAYIEGTVTPSTIATLNHFFNLVGWPLTAILPPAEPQPTTEPE